MPIRVDTSIREDIARIYFWTFIEILDSFVWSYENDGNSSMLVQIDVS